MTRLIIITFAFMGWVFYVMSGGSEFDPVETLQARIDLPTAVEQEKLDTVLASSAALPNDVTRVALNLTSVDEVLRPAPTLNTEKAEIAAPVEDTITAGISEEKPSIILPSLVGNAAVVTRVDFSQDGSTNADPLSDVRAVTGRSVNVRGGPSTDFSVVSRLMRGDEVEVLQDPGNGWVQLRSINGGTVGWMADFLLSEG